MYTEPPGVPSYVPFDDALYTIFLVETKSEV